jgi:hypothetical protein
MGGRKGFGPISESDFSSLLQALSGTTKGRSFLAEYRRRCQPTETLGLLDSLERIETTIEGVRSQLRPELVVGEIQHVAMTLDIAVEGVNADPEGDETARRFALVERARHELRTLSETLMGETAELEKPASQPRSRKPSAR